MSKEASTTDPNFVARPRSPVPMDEVGSDPVETSPTDAFSLAFPPEDVAAGARVPSLISEEAAPPESYFAARLPRVALMDEVEATPVEILSVGNFSSAMPSPLRPEFASAGDSLTMDEVVFASVEPSPIDVLSPYSSDYALSITRLNRVLPLAR